jgi:hypothetical protein
VPLLIEPAFLSFTSACAIRAAMDRGALTMPRSWRRHHDSRHMGGARAVSRSSRRARAGIEDRLDAMRPAIDEPLGRPLGPTRGDGFLRLPAGGFYRQHRDRGDVAGWPAAAKRSVAVVIFLNGRGPGRPAGVRRRAACASIPIHRSSTRDSPRNRAISRISRRVSCTRSCLSRAVPATWSVDWFYDR